ncbi:type II secretion system F family protein [Thalassotalea sp. G2M2-11]|uniref:type II secretion system F family protein n=1 Tax=Thalassotalea sp. G2M2-11 TaxID=2787627 RepID=UPI0019D21E70|nr:type II secretion system F family protein [Thalassotalea sp. G2M2-11]
MAAFDYTGRDSRGQQVKGLIEAATTSAVAEQLSRQQIIPISIKPAKSGKAAGASAPIDIGDLLGFDAISLDDLIVFCRQMYALVRSGVPILRAINGMSESSNSPKLKTALAEVATQLEGGYTLSSALNQHPHLFAPLFISLIHVGENTGQLDGAFLKLASYFEREQETRKRVKTALRYPSFVLAAIAIAMVILNIFVIPTFANMFAKLGADLPWATQVLIASSNFFLDFWPYMLVVLVFLFFGTRAYVRTAKGRYKWDRFKTKLPIVGSIIERSILARFSHSFAIVLKAGVPMTSGLTLVADAVDNSFMSKKIIAMRSAIESGESLLRSAVASTLFTPLVLQMVSVGEETGRVDELLEEVGDYYEREVDYELGTLTARIEPILIAIVAGMVLILALGIFTPMWDMMSAFKGK